MAFISAGGKTYSSGSNRTPKPATGSVSKNSSSSSKGSGSSSSRGSSSGSSRAPIAVKPGKVNTSIGSGSSSGSIGSGSSYPGLLKPGGPGVIHTPSSGSSSGSSTAGGNRYVNVAPGGNAPAGTQIGDIVITAGGNYKVVAPGTSGATYNPSSGLWSVKVSGSGSSGGGSNGYNPMGNYFDSGLSQRDKTAIESLQMAWEEAMAKGDTVGASQYHQWAEDIREKYGYSGGADGSMYIPIELEEDKLPNVGLPVYEPQTEMVNNLYDSAKNQALAALESAYN